MLIISVVTAGCCIILAWLLLHSYSSVQCVDDLGNNSKVCRHLCQYGYFSLFGMQHCQPWLSCAEVMQIEIVEELNGGAVKQVKLR
jgi:hypothetical protein